MSVTSCLVDLFAFRLTWRPSRCESFLPKTPSASSNNALHSQARHFVVQWLLNEDFIDQDKLDYLMERKLIGPTTFFTMAKHQSRHQPPSSTRLSPSA
ncbi:hypothetical protein CYY_010169 [Polysphondylium violaceum]|uniref:Uncharacterized protein n=1 Tax=Polysphondylium violaceum TaxID=133409 RepID=A0A8J4UVC3_9MYCE|nr:hypothetical protein CYY_010169 [Polysphondylium violaceum]